MPPGDHLERRGRLWDPVTVYDRDRVTPRVPPAVRRGVADRVPALPVAGGRLVRSAVAAAVLSIADRSSWQLRRRKARTARSSLCIPEARQLAQRGEPVRYAVRLPPPEHADRAGDLSERPVARFPDRGRPDRHPRVRGRRRMWPRCAEKVVLQLHGARGAGRCSATRRSSRSAVSSPSCCRSRRSST